MQTRQKTHTLTRYVHEYNKTHRSNTATTVWRTKRKKQPSAASSLRQCSAPATQSAARET